MIISKINILSAGKVAGAIYFLVGIIAAFFTIWAGYIGSALSGDLGGGAYVGSIFGGISFIFLPIMYGVMGFIVGIIAASLYNLIARYIGGLEIEVTQKSAKSINPSQVL